MSDMVFQPSSAKPLFVRPLSPGMYTDRAGQQLPQGAFIDLQNLIANLEGPRRRPPFTAFAGTASTAYDILDYVTLWRTNGEQVSLLLTTKSMYKVNPLTGHTEVAWAYSTGTVTVSGVNITGAGTLWLTNDIRPGDILRIGAVEAVIEAVGTETTLTTLTTPFTNGAGQPYSIQRAFGPGNNPVLDTAVIDDSLAIVDGKRPIMRYNPDTNAITLWTTSTSKMPGGIEFCPSTVCSWGNRLWAGYTYDATDKTQRQRIRWSSLADSADFSFATAYLDLPYTNGALRKLLPMGPFLMAYFDDAVYMGRPTNNPFLPVDFTLLDTGGIGVVGPRAVTHFLGGHCFVGQDDIYLVTQQGAQPIASHVIKQDLLNCKYPGYVYAVPDPNNYRMCFGFPTSNPFIEKVWGWDYRSKGWSYDILTTTMLGNPAINSTSSWDNLTGTWNTIPITTWDGLSFSTGLERSLYCSVNRRLWRQSQTGSLDFDTSPIPVTFVTQDHDMDTPDTQKYFTRFSLKIDWKVPLTDTLRMTIDVSVDRGRTWKTAGVLQIPPSHDEGFVNFRALGSTVRFRGRSTSTVGGYWISEYGMRVRLGGSELGLGASQ